MSYLCEKCRVKEPSVIHPLTRQEICSACTIKDLRESHVQIKRTKFIPIQPQVLRNRRSK